MLRATPGAEPALAQVYAAALVGGRAADFAVVDEAAFGIEVSARLGIKLWLFGGGVVFEGRRGHGAAPSSGSLKSAPGYLGPFPLFERTDNRDHEKLCNDFKRRAALLLRSSDKADRSAHRCAASIQRARLAGGDGPMSGHSMR